MGIVAFSSLSASDTKRAQVTPQYLDQLLLQPGITIIDIRTAREWEETGVVPGSHTLTFFDQEERYDADRFIEELLQISSMDGEIAILCRSGNRSDKVARYLVKHGFTHVVNVLGGIKQAKETGLTLQPFSPHRKLKL
jgi:rhodanese-related sulfurtransferase